VLRTAFQCGCDDALSRYGVKTAAVPLARPAPFKPPTPHVPTAQPGFKLTPQEEAQAARMKGMSHEQRQQELGLDQHTQTGTTPPAAAGAARPGGIGRFLRPAGKALGIGALAAGGALAYGIHRSNQEDRKKYPLVYAPMSGGMY